jgi:hypothetical protein
LSRNPLLFFMGLQGTSREFLQQQREDTERANSTVLDSSSQTKEIGLRIKKALEQGPWWASRGPLRSAMREANMVHIGNPG